MGWHKGNAGFRTHPTGEKAFVRVTGKTPKEMNAEWVRWMR